MFIGRAKAGQWANHSKAIQWTNHSKAKMRFYGLSEQRVLRVINSPQRIEEGIAPKTVAMMQPSSLKIFGKNADWKQEIWVMVQNHATQSMKPETWSTKYKKGHPSTKIISAWRYPGRTKPGEPLPPEILAEMRSAIY